MVTDEGICPTGQAESIFQFASASEDHFNRKGELDREGDISSRPPEDIGFCFKDPCDRVVAPHMDLTIVKEEIVSDIAETLKGLIIFVADASVGEKLKVRLVRIAARHANGEIVQRLQN